MKRREFITLVASARWSKVSYVVSRSEDINLK
jgi:hypothetical protein